MTPVRRITPIVVLVSAVLAVLLTSPAASARRTSCSSSKSRCPRNTVAPTVSGTTTAGQTLTASAGTWTGATQPYAYQWRRCDTSGANCVNIAGATSTTYALASSDVGSTMRVRVTATNSYGSVTADSAATATVVATPTPPTNVVPPAISGSAQDGQSLSGSAGVWNGSTPMTDAYQWRRCDSAGAACADITGATGSSYLLRPGDVGSRLRVVVTATNSMGSGTASSAAGGVVSAVAPASTAAPAITGPAQQGQTLNAGTGTWSGTPPITFAYQWRRCDTGGSNCMDVVGAATASYSPTVLDLGSTLRVAVTATNAGGSSTAVSDPTAVVSGGSDVQPSFPIRAAFYYPWYPQTWTVGGQHPHYMPTLGYYDSSSPTVIQQHVQAMQYGNVEAAIASWWGQGSTTDLRMPQLLSTTNNMGSPVRWSIYYEAEGNGDPTVSQITSDLTYIRDHYGNDPAYLRVNGHFVVFVYGGSSDGCSTADRWAQANTVNAYIVLKVFSGYRTCANQPDSWHQYSPAVASDSQSGYSYSISPGFWKADEPTPRLARDLSRWSLNVRDMVASNAPWQLVTTFNEWGEGTAAESANEWSSASGYGAYLDALHDNGAGNGDGTPPTPPSNLATSNLAGTSLTLSWTASTDNVGVAGYRVYVGSSNVATTTSTSQAITGLTCGTSYTLGVEAYDAAGNTSTRSTLAASTAACAPPPPPPPPPSGPCGTASTPPNGYDHVIWVWMENKAYSSVVGSGNAPYENSLANSCGLATNYHATTHPSLPNYIAATSGDYWGIADDNGPGSHPLAVPSIYSQVRAAGKTWRDYEESATGNCPLSSSGQYAVKHDPAPYYTGVRTDCQSWDMPLGTTTSGNLRNDLNNNTLPDYAFITPNLCNDTHDCSVATGDAWLQNWLPLIFASPAYQAGRTALILTWDENDGSAGNQIPAIVVSPSTVPGTRSSTAFNHYSLLKTTEQMLGINTYLAHAGDSGTTSMAQTFNLLP
jgi:hypothetical protein